MTALAHVLEALLDEVESNPRLKERLRDAFGAGGDREWLDRTRFELVFPGVKFRQIREAARAGLIELGGTPRKPLVRRDEVERFLREQQRAKRSTTKPQDEDVQATLDAASARILRQSGAGSKPASD